MFADDSAGASETLEGLQKLIEKALEYLVHFVRNGVVGDDEREEVRSSFM